MLIISKSPNSNQNPSKDKLLLELTTMLFTGGFQPSQTIPPFMWHTAITDCGNDCIARVNGCMDTLAINYNSEANTEDSTCYYNPGCTSSAYLEYYTQGFIADYDDGTCLTIAVWGCMDSTAFNFDSLSNISSKSNLL